jgi:hypothetical protein
MLTIVGGGIESIGNTLDQESVWEHGSGEVVGGWDHENGGHNDLKTKSKLNFVLGLHGMDVSGEEGGGQADKDPDGRNSNWKANSAPTSTADIFGLSSDHKSSAS